MAATGTKSRQRRVKKAAQGFSEIGTTGLKQRGGFAREEFLPELRGSQGLQKFREMRDNDATIGAILFAISNLIAGVKWRVDPADEKSEEAVEIADLFEGMLFRDMSHTWQDTLTEILTFLEFGYSYFEVVLKRRIGPLESNSSRRSNFTDGLIGIRKLAPRPQETRKDWKLDDHGGLIGFIQKSHDGFGEKLIPIERSLLFRSRSRKNSPEGVSVLRTAYRNYVLLKNTQDAEAQAIDRELNGLPVIRLPSELLKSQEDADKALVAEYEALGRDVRFNDQTSIILPSDPWIDAETNRMTNMRMVEFELISSTGTRAIDTHKVKIDHKSDIARSVLAQFLMLGNTGVGSMALGKDMRKLFTSAILAFIRQITAPIDRHLIPRLMACNGFPLELAPSLAHEDIDPPDLDQVANLLTALTNGGAQVFPDERLENDIRAKGKLPPVPEGRDLDEIPEIVDPEEDDLDDE